MKRKIDIMTALYDEQEVMDRYVASREQEAKIEATVKMYHRFGKSISEAINGIVSDFGLSQSSAESKAKQYWSQA